MPIIEPEVSIKSPERAAADESCSAELTRALDALPDDRQVMLKLSLPVEPNLFAPLVDHPRVARVVALRADIRAARRAASSPAIAA